MNLKRRLEKAEAAVKSQRGDSLPLVMYGPVGARIYDACDPPGGMEDPVWHKDTGWLAAASIDRYTIILRFDDDAPAPDY